MSTYNLVVVSIVVGGGFELGRRIVGAVEDLGVAAFGALAARLRRR